MFKSIHDLLYCIFFYELHFTGFVFSGFLIVSCKHEAHIEELIFSYSSI